MMIMCEQHMYYFDEEKKNFFFGINSNQSIKRNGNVLKKNYERCLQWKYLKVVEEKHIQLMCGYIK